MNIKQHLWNSRPEFWIPILLGVVLWCSQPSRLEIAKARSKEYQAIREAGAQAASDGLDEGQNPYRFYVYSRAEAHVWKKGFRGEGEVSRNLVQSVAKVSTKVSTKHDPIYHDSLVFAQVTLVKAPVRTAAGHQLSTLGRLKIWGSDRSVRVQVPPGVMFLLGLLTRPILGGVPVHLAVHLFGPQFCRHRFA